MILKTTQNLMCCRNCYSHCDYHFYWPISLETTRKEESYHRRHPEEIGQRIWSFICGRENQSDDGKCKTLGLNSVGSPLDFGSLLLLLKYYIHLLLSRKNHPVYTTSFLKWVLLQTPIRLHLVAPRDFLWSSILSPSQLSLRSFQLSEAFYTGL